MPVEWSDGCEDTFDQDKGVPHFPTGEREAGGGSKEGQGSKENSPEDEEMEPGRQERGTWGTMGHFQNDVMKLFP